jgi:hypothetical protein
MTDPRPPSAPDESPRHEPEREPEPDERELEAAARQESEYPPDETDEG